MPSLHNQFLSSPQIKPKNIIPVRSGFYEVGTPEYEMIISNTSIISDRIKNLVKYELFHNYIMEEIKLQQYEENTFLSVIQKIYEGGASGKFYNVYIFKRLDVKDLYDTHFSIEYNTIDKEMLKNIKGNQLLFSW